MHTLAEDKDEKTDNTPSKYMHCAFMETTIFELTFRIIGPLAPWILAKPTEVCVVCLHRLKVKAPQKPPRTKSFHLSVNVCVQELGVLKHIFSNR